MDEKPTHERNMAMNKLMIAAATALCATATMFAHSAEAGMRFGGGFRFHHFHFRPHFAPPAHHHYRAPVEHERVYRSRRAKSKPEPTKVPLVKFADGTGRQYDPASKVWFDGETQCYSGKEAFTFKNGAWFYGKSRWTQSDNAWVSSADAQPELVSCESVPSFAAKANAFALKTAAQSDKAETPKTTADQPIKAPAPKIKTAEGTSGAASLKPAPAPEAVCKKYFPSVGQMLPVPCGE
jgi:hypothetical protein